MRYLKSSEVTEEKLLWTIFLIFILFCVRLASCQENLLENANDFDRGQLVDNPWGGVSNSKLTVLPGAQLAVRDEGGVVSNNLGPSVAIGDLTGDGLSDLVVADAKGFFWFFPNSGTPKQPKFTYGEIMPIWVGNPGSSQYRVDPGEDNTVPRICLVDLDKDGRLDLVAGNYEGKLYYFHNTGSRQQPKFSMPQDLADILVPTRSRGKLWCNYLAPCLYEWQGGGLLDLIMGDGTYSANSIYLLANEGTNLNPIFKEANTVKIIPGMGREDLTPQVMDWNNDGKPDIIAGERAGNINLYLNTTTDPTHPQFDQGQHVKFGDSEMLGQFTTVTVGDLTDNKLPNLAISNSDNHVLYAENKGMPGNPRFGAPVPVQGSNPLPKIIRASNWTLEKALGIPYVNLVCTNKQVEADFEPPSPEFKSALKYYTESHVFNADFPDQFYPQEDTQWIRYGSAVTLRPQRRYTLSFWVKSDGNISNLVYWFSAYDINARYELQIMKPISASGPWTHFSDSFSFELPDNINVKAFECTFRIAFNGHPTLYFDGFKLVEH